MLMCWYSLVVRASRVDFLPYRIFLKAGDQVLVAMAEQLGSFSLIF